MNRHPIKQRGKQRNGFTLVELIIVIVLLGIMGTIGAGFITEAFRGFFDADVRMEMYEEGKGALVRMERELRIAVPNAVDVPTGVNAGESISFGVVDEKTMAEAGVFGQYTDEHPTGTTTITDRTAGLPVNSLVSLYNINWPVFSTGSQIYRVNAVNGSQMTLDRNIGLASPYNRYYAVRPQAVRFEVNGTTLSRATATITANGPVGTFGNLQVLARNVVPSGALPFFSYEQGSSTRNSVVTIHFAISRNDETLTFHKEVQVRNVP